MSLKPTSFGKLTRSIQTLNLMELALVVVIVATLFAIMLPIFGRGSQNHNSADVRDSYNSGSPSTFQIQPVPRSNAARPCATPHQCVR